jgi:hypothetical protein
LVWGHGLMVGRSIALVALAGMISTASAAELPVPPVAPSGPHADILFNQEIRYFSWTGTRGYPAPGIASTARGSGWQLYTPATLQATTSQPDLFKFEFVGRGGYVVSKQATVGATGSVSSLTDTVTSATWTYLGMPGLQPFISANANLPTGRSFLSIGEAFARMDPDLVDIATFGEGWNFGGTVGVNVPISQNAVVSFGAGHTWRGEYDRDDPSGVVSLVRIEPGDVTSFNASAVWRSGPFGAQISGTYAREGSSSFNGVPAFQLGDRFIIAGSGSFVWNDDSISILSASWTHTDKNRTINPPAILFPITEAFNSNSNVLRLRFEHAFRAGAWSAGPIVSWLHRDNNAYSPTALQFVAAKTRWAAGGVARFSVNDKTLLYASIERIWIDEGARPASVPFPAPDLSYRGWVAMGGGTVRF